MTLQIITVLLGLVIATVHASFHVMQKAVPRHDFVRVSKSDSDIVHELIFAVKQNHLTELESMLMERSTPSNHFYQQWLTYDEISVMTTNQIAAEAVTAWLQENDVAITDATTNSHYIKASAPIYKWEQLLNTQFHQWEDRSRHIAVPNDNRFIHRATEYSLPHTIKDHLSAVFNTVQVPPVFKEKYHKRENPRFRTDLTISSAKDTISAAPAKSKITKEDVHPNGATATDGTVTVAFLNKFYQITSNTGSAEMQQSVFETAGESFSPRDLTDFQNTYNLPKQAAEAPYGFDTEDCVTNDCGEGNLDVQYIMGVAQQTVSIYWYVTDNSTTDPFVAWLVDVANTTNPPLANSMSWGSIEQENSPDVMDAFNTEAMKLAAMGVTVTVSSGDDGVASDKQLCNADSGVEISDWPYESKWAGKGYFPSFPATSPYVTAVGATQGPENGDPEITCQSQLGGVITSGGGFSTYYAQPTWQKTAVDAYFSGLATQPQSGFNPLGRAYPDVSMIGVYYQVYIQGQIESLFGTSCSSPVLAAFVSLANAARQNEGLPPIGYMNPTLWAYGNPNNFGPGGSNYYPFNDVTSGENNCIAYGGPNPSKAHCCTSGFTAAPGWDPTTGFGSVNYTSFYTMFLAPKDTPSHEPTAAPTEMPSAPTVMPSAMPTAPTVVPTIAPTTLVTLSPTRKPTTTATTKPTARPTVRPSASAPSLRPTSPPSPIVSFTTNVTLDSVTSATLDELSQQAVVQTTAAMMGVSVSAVTFTGSIVKAALFDSVETRTGKTIKKLQIKKALADFSLIVQFFTQVALSDSTYTDTTSLYDGLVNNLQSSVSSGTYSTVLHDNAASLSATQVANADASETSSSLPTVINSDSSSGDSNDLTDGEIAGIVIGVLVGLMLIGVAIAYACSMRNASGGLASAADQDFATSSSRNARMKNPAAPAEEL